MLYWRGYKTQIFKTEAEEEPLAKETSHKHAKLIVKYSFGAHLEKIDAAILKLERFFPGLQVITITQK